MGHSRQDCGACFYVYILFRLNGVPCYVGKGKGTRWQDHGKKRCGNEHLRRVIQKARRAGKELPRVKIRTDLSEHDAFELERLFIAAIGRADCGKGPLVNHTNGGEGEAGRIVSRRQRKLLSKANIGKRQSLESRYKKSLALKGRPHPPHTEKTKRKMRRVKRKKAEFSPESRARLASCGHRNHPHTDETRKKMRSARLRFFKKNGTPEEARQSMRNAAIGGWETRRANHGPTGRRKRAA